MLNIKDLNQEDEIDQGTLETIAGGRMITNSNVVNVGTIIETNRTEQTEVSTVMPDIFC